MAPTRVRGRVGAWSGYASSPKSRTGSPGLGGSVVDWIAYGHAIQTTRNRQDYGTGDVRGVIAPESANNAKEGGALVPTLLLGIPGSGSMAILLGGLIIIPVAPSGSSARPWRRPG